MQKDGEYECRSQRSVTDIFAVASQPVRAEAKVSHPPRMQFSELISLLADGLRKLEQELQHPSIHPERRFFALLTSLVELAKSCEANIESRPESLKSTQYFEIALETKASCLYLRFVPTEKKYM